MDDTKNEGMVCGGCGTHGCGNYGGGEHHGNFAMRLLLGIAIIVIVFWMGVKIGELKGMLESDYGYGHMKMMRNYGDSGSYRMMNNDTTVPPVQ